MRRIEDMGINELLGIIARSPEGERRERALSAALAELLEVEISWRIDLRHQNPGYHKASSIASAGEARGQLTGRVDHVGQAAERYRYACRWRSMSEALLAHLNERQRMAVLLCGYALPELRHQRAALGEIEMHHAMLAGERAMRDTAWRARAKLLPLVGQQAKMAI